MSQLPIYRASTGIKYLKVETTPNKCSLPSGATCAFSGSDRCTERDIGGLCPCRGNKIIFLTPEKYAEHRLLGEI